MDAATLGQIIEQLKRTGKNTDPAGTSTLFAQLKQIAAYVDTLEAQLGTNNDGSTATGNLHQKVSDLKYHLGNITDGASPDGTVHAKLRDIRNLFSSGVGIVSTVRHVLRGEASLSPSETSASVTISPINPAKSLLVFSYDANVYGASDLERYTFIRGTINSSTTLNFKRALYPGGSNGGWTYINWQVVEFY